MSMSNWKEVLDIRKDSAPISEIADRIEADSSVTGANLIILIMAILIASIGLNMNSVAVIIGAMLISPLMGGIVATGYGMATYDLHFLKRSVVKMSFQIVFALITSGLYFSLTPLTTPSPEMLARTAPTAWDVLIALCGGIAGAIGNTRKKKSNVIPGVAIATALMPPLCTAGYGLAMGSFKFFTGAIYLFFINGFFIAFSSFLIFKALKVPMAHDISEAHYHFQQHVLIAVGFIITIPSIYMAYLTVNDNIRDSQVQTFVSQDMDLDSANVVAYNLEDGTLNVDVVGMALSKADMEDLQKKLNHYTYLKDVKLRIVQGNVNSINQDQVQEIVNARLANAVKDSDGHSYKDLATQYYDSYKREVADQSVLQNLNKEAPVLFPDVQEITGSTLLHVDVEKKVMTATAFQAYVTVHSPMSPADASRLQRWISTQTSLPVILTVQQASTPSSFYGNGIDWNE